ncbi:MAG: low temperature requirement protein A [Nonomuraea sp.]|nr:low temperature requirement protein A [Nonomuraea sp.]
MQEKRVTWAELFFDLVFVFAITQVSALLHADHGWQGLLRALVIFVPIYWAWVGTSIHANTNDVDTPAERIGIFAVGLCALFMALAVPQAYGTRGLLFGLSYFAIRLFLAFLAYRVQPLTLRAYGIAALVSGPLLVIGALLDGPARLVAWGLAALTDLATPMIARSRLRNVRFDPNHLPERFGLFLIIALGESIVATGMPAATASHLDAGMIAAVSAAFVLVCALWGVYYHYAASAIVHAMRTAPLATEIIRPVLSYGHLGFVAGIVTMASGMAEVVAHPLAALPLPTAGLLYGGCALYLATFGYTRWRMFRKAAKTRVGAAIVVLAVLPATPLLPALAALALLAALVVALNVLEYLLVTHRGGL